MSERSPEVPVRVAMIGLSVLWVVLLVGVVASRLTFPLELEWMEGGSMIQALRAQRGAPLCIRQQLVATPPLRQLLLPHALQLDCGVVVLLEHRGGAHQRVWATDA